MRWCRYYFLVNPLINATITKMAEYPVTEIVIDERDAKVKEKWEKILGQHLRYRAFQIECGLDFFTYGIVFVTVHFPFTKFLKCRHCGFEEKAGKTQYKWRNLEYIIECSKCGAVGPAIVKDFYQRDFRRIRLQRWNPEYVNIDPCFAGADPVYSFELPLQLRNDLILGKKNVLDTIPDIFVEAMRRNKFISFTPENIFVLKRPNISQKDEGWGMPLIFPVLKDTFYLQILRKAQEAIAQEHIVPLRVLFPSGNGADISPYSTINLDSWKTRMEQEIAKWKYDCVSPDSVVEGRDGLLGAGEVQKGTFLKNHLGSYSEVEKVWRRPLREDEKAYRVVVAGLHGAIPTVSEGHPFLARRGAKIDRVCASIGPSTFIRVKNLHPGDYVGYPIGREIGGPKSLDLAEFCTNAATKDWIYIDHQSQEVPEAFEYLESSPPTNSRQSLLEERGWSVNQYKIAQMAVRDGRSLRRLPRFLPLDEELAWVAGLYLAEGSATPKQVFFALHDEEKEFQKRLNSFFSCISFQASLTSMGASSAETILAAAWVRWMRTSRLDGSAGVLDMHTLPQKRL